MDPAALPEHHDSDKENLPPTPSSSSPNQPNPDPVPATAQSSKKTRSRKPKKRKRIFSRRKRRVGTRKPLADITHISIESSSVQETETSVDLQVAATSSVSAVQETGSDLHPAPASGSRSSTRKRKAADENDPEPQGSPKTKSLRMGFR